MAKGRHEVRAARKRWPLIVGLVAGVLVLALGGVAYATFRYEQANANRLLSGTTIGGVDVSGMTRAEAIAAVRELARADLDREIVVVVDGERFTTTARELGRRTWVGRAVGQAMDASERDRLGRAGMASAPGRSRRPRHRAAARGVRRRGGVRPPNGAGGERRPSRTPPSRSTDPGASSSGRRSRVRPSTVRQAERLLAGALDDGSSMVRLPVHAVTPEITPQTMLPTIVVHVDTNRLDLYEGFEVTHSWDVATAKPGWTTPVGEWSLYQKRENPTWYNPALDSWGADLPAVVPGGPGNPMGTRALYITAPGLIRIHGTTSPDSIGRYASHGCIRMHNEQVEELYDLVPVGTKVIIMGSRPSGASEWDFPDTPDGSDTVA